MREVVYLPQTLPVKALRPEHCGRVARQVGSLGAKRGCKAARIVGRYAFFGLRGRPWAAAGMGIVMGFGLRGRPWAAPGMRTVMGFGLRGRPWAAQRRGPYVNCPTSRSPASGGPNVNKLATNRIEIIDSNCSAVWPPELERERVFG